MADTLQTLSLIVLAQMYKDGIARQANRQSVALKLLPLLRGAGQNVAFVAENTGIVVENYAEGADVTNFGSDSQDKALLNWAEYRANFHVSGLARATAASSASPLGNQSLWLRNVQNAATALASKLNGELYTGAGTGTLMAGLDVAIGSVSNTYAGIDRTSKTYWQPNLFNSAGPASSLTFAQIRADMQAIMIAGGTRPDIALCHPNVLAKVAGLFDPQKQYQFVTSKVDTAAGSFDLEGGIGGIRFDGCVFVEDKDATDGKIYYVNTSKVHLEVLPMDLASVPGMSDQVMAVLGDDGMGPLPFGFQLENISKAGDSDRAMMKSYLQLCVRQPNACGIRLNIA